MRAGPSFTPRLALLVPAMVLGFSSAAAQQPPPTPQPAEKQAAAPVDQTLERVRNCSVEERDINADCRAQVAQQPAGKTPKAAAPVDLTGTWASIVTEDWRWRVMTPPKGDYASLPLNPEGKRVADTWDPADRSNGCKVYGAAGLLRNPTRVRLSWADESTLKLETDHGVQTRQFRFGSAAPGGGTATLQGDSVAAWDHSGLKVVTTSLSPGYLRKNGVPYSDKTVLTEFYNRYSAFGADWLLVTTVVVDPTYLSREFITSSHFKRLPDDSGWHPVPCTTS